MATRAIVAGLALALCACAAAERQAAPGPVSLTTEQDHARTMALLGIEALRPGRNGLDPNAPNFANYDEAKANPYPDLPDPLVMQDGRRVSSAAMWRERRAEIAELFDREIYGRTPARTPSVRWEVIADTVETIGAQRARVRRFIGHVDNSAYPAIRVDLDMQVLTPAEARGPVPVVLNLLWIDPPDFLRNFPPPAADYRELILARGWAAAILVPSSVQADNGEGLTAGIIGLVNRGQPRGLEDWGALKAWAWGASRALDYFVTDPALDARRVAIQGHSRYGKAALVAMAYDERFAAGFISSSGAGGAALLRRDYGEIVENLASSGEYHWMAGNFLQYAGPLGWDDLPVDAHELIALAAPRPVFISSGAFEGDAWVDARGMFLAAAAASPVYALLGVRGLSGDTFPPIETGLLDGKIGFRQHSEGHTPGPNWPYFLDFAAGSFAAAPE